MSSQEKTKRKWSVPTKVLVLVGIGLMCLGVFVVLPLIDGRDGPDQPDQLILARYDLDGDGVLNTEERASARREVANSGGGRRPRRRGPRGRDQSQGQPGLRLSPKDVANYPDEELYDRTVLRTLFFDFESAGWEQELADFKATDVEIPATLTVDGTAYPNVGVSFRGASSFFTISSGLKRSFNISMDLIDESQRLYGYKTLNLLNCNGDPSLMSSALYSDIARERIAAPKVNFVRVVVNGESWGLYANIQQFNKDFLKENYGSRKGSRWKVHGSPNGDGGLRYLGEDVELYREKFEIKSKDKPEAWRDLVDLCKKLNQTPEDQIEDVLNPILDIDGTLWFLAVDVALMNSDGYWTRASDYSIYQNANGVFHILPHDMNEAFRAAHGTPGGDGGWLSKIPGFGGGPPPGGGPGVQGQELTTGELTLEPLVSTDEPRFALRQRLLANSQLRTRYLQYVRAIAQVSLNWEFTGRKVTEMRELLKNDVAADTRKLSTTAAFELATSGSVPAAPGSLREFFEKRSAFLLNHADIKNLPQLDNANTADSGEDDG